jgi:hypothetical protein
MNFAKKSLKWLEGFTQGMWQAHGCVPTELRNPEERRKTKCQFCEEQNKIRRPTCDLIFETEGDEEIKIALCDQHDPSKKENHWARNHLEGRFPDARHYRLEKI